MKINDFINQIIKKTDIVLFHNDLKKTLWFLKDDFNNDLNIAASFFLNLLIDGVGEEGTILIPTFNWNFCKGLPFDYNNTTSQTGILGNLALKDNRFKRTKHPIYSFAVYGKHRDELYDLDNLSSFGMDSPFGFIYKKNAKIVMWDVDWQRSFTFAHFIEQQTNVDYRYEKSFSGLYVDESGMKTIKEYSMFVRNLEQGIITHLNPIGKIFEDAGLVERYNFQDIDVKVVKAKEIFDRAKLELGKNKYIMVRFEKYSGYKIGQSMHDLMRRLYPINRSITGSGFRKSLEIIKEYLPDLQIKEVSSGEKCFDWTVPDEWDADEAYIEEAETGKRIVDFRENNLHLVSYSTAIDKILTFEELDKHLHYREDLSDAIPYVTSYYNPYWGFCLSYNQYKNLDKNKKYRVVIKSRHFKGVLNYGELIIKGKTNKEVFFSTYLCHPSMANNELSGPALATFLAKYVLSKKDRNLTYRFIFIPETIGSICYLTRNLKILKKNVIAGFVLTCVGDEGKFSYLPSRYENTLADKVALNLLKYEIKDYNSYTYLDRGSDERQYCWPGIDLPVCLIMKSKFGEYKEYHTSLDNLDFVTPKGLEDSYNFYTKLIEVIENNNIYKTNTLGEPQLGKRGLYHSISHINLSDKIRKIRDFLVYADGTNDLIDIANLIDRSAYELIEIKNILVKHNLIEEA